MAKVLTSIFKSNFYSSIYINNVFKHDRAFTVPVRYLYAQSALGLNGYIQNRENIGEQFKQLSDKFRTKMTDFAEDNNKSLIFTLDLKNMLHLAEKEDIPLVIKMMKKFNRQNKELRFGNFIFGPVVMRMFYFLNEPNVALECFNAPELNGFFDQLISYQLLLDLLYENNKYDEILQTFDIIKLKQIQGIKYPKNIVTLAMAACYKLNTSDSLNYALALWSELNNVGHLPMRKAATFCAALALNQGKPDVALEIVSTVRTPNYVTVRNLKTAALADIGRFEELLLVLKSVLEIDDPNNLKHTFCKDVINQAKTAVEKQDNPNINQEFARVEKYLLEQGLIVNSSLDTYLCSEIISPVQQNNGFDKRPQYKYIQRNQYTGNQTNKYKVSNQRVGLKDLY